MFGILKKIFYSLLSKEELGSLGLLIKGGWAMIPLVFFSFVAVYQLFYLFYLFIRTRNSNKMVKVISDGISKNNQEALKYITVQYSSDF